MGVVEGVGAGVGAAVDVGVDVVVGTGVAVAAEESSVVRNNQHCGIMR